MREKKNTRRKKQNIKIHTLAARRASELRERERVYTTNISRHIINIIKRHVLYRLIKTRRDLYFCVFHPFLMSQRKIFSKTLKLFLGSPVGRSVGRSLDARRTIIMSKEAILEKPTNSSGDDFDDGALATSSSSSSTPEKNFSMGSSTFPEEKVKEEEKEEEEEETTAHTAPPNAVKSMNKDDDDDVDDLPRFNFRRVLTHKESHRLAKGIKSSSALPKSGCYVHYCVYCGGERGCPIGMSYNKFTREIMCWSLNTYPFGCCSLPMQRDWKEYVSIKNDIKVVVIDKETNTLACFSGVQCCYCQPLFDS